MPRNTPKYGNIEIWEYRNIQIFGHRNVEFSQYHQTHGWALARVYLLIEMVPAIQSRKVTRVREPVHLILRTPNKNAIT